MFLQRKFMQPFEKAAAAEDGLPPGLPPRVREVMNNLGRLLATQRGIGHLLPDFGFSQSGHWSVEGLIVHYSAELRENLARYEPRLELLDVEGDLGDEGWPELTLELRVAGVEGLWEVVLDPVRRLVRDVRPISAAG